MKLLYLFISLSLISSCSNNDSKAKKYEDDDPRSLIGKWEIRREYYNNQKLFDLTDRSQSYSDEVLKGMKKNYLHFLPNKKIKGGVWINNPKKPIAFTRKGIYKIDDQKLGIEILNDGPHRFIGGTFKWKVKNNHSYLYSMNHQGSYQVYRRSE